MNRYYNNCYDTITHIHANSSPNEAYANVYAEPVTGTLAANSEYVSADSIADTAPIRNDITTPGPVENLCSELRNKN